MEPDWYDVVSRRIVLVPADEIREEWAKLSERQIWVSEGIA